MKKIAVVEDNPDNSLLIEAILGGEYEVTVYENGPDALAGIPGFLPELILLDIALPGMDGVEVLANLRMMESIKDLPVIALTAHAMVGDKNKYLEEGFDSYYSKPILDIDDFKAVVKSFL
ncbi:MAG: response regulator [Candidatus Marinimicrobia bacterium]|nr:response regulator [Candidatus Neomarinimicrobiota bacterium]